jgi:hypothetical protein
MLVSAVSQPPVHRWTATLARRPRCNSFLRLEKNRLSLDIPLTARATNTMRINGDADGNSVARVMRSRCVDHHGARAAGLYQGSNNQK